jgi:Flp pilus assembly protein TadG
MPDRASSRPRGTRSGQAGQTLVLMVVFLTVLLGVAGLAIDVGNWWLQRSELQNAVDASALAGADALPGGWTSAQTAAQTTYGKDGQSSDQVTYSQTTDLTANDSVRVTATRNVPTWFTSLLGISSAKITVTARATVESYNQLAGPNVMPWGVLQGTYTPGQNYPIYTKTSGSTGNNGALSLPYVSSANCPVPSGANSYSDEISGSLSVCPITVGESVSTKTGDNSGPTASGLNQRITTWQPLSKIVSFNADGTANLLEPSSPQLVLIPILTNPDGTNTWPSGTSSPMTVVGFAYFVITSCGNPASPSYCNSSDGKEVNGVFVTLEGDQTVGTGGSYTPGSNTAYTAALTQ